jgi:hypothetical protein
VSPDLSLIGKLVPEGSKVPKQLHSRFAKKPQDANAVSKTNKTVIAAHTHREGAKNAKIAIAHSTMIAE